MSATATEGASMMAKASKRVRSPKWDDAETMLLAELKWEAFLRGEEGGHVWYEISQTISGRSAIQCQRRWETLVKVYSHVQEYCTQTGQDHEELDNEELASMKLETAYRRDWYSIVHEVCSQRKRRQICDGGAAAMVSKGSSTPVVETLLTTRPATTDIVQEVCSQRKRIRICDGGAAAILSKGSSTPVMETFLTTRPATTDSPVDTSPDSEVCSQLKRRRICDRRSAVMLSKGISTPVMETLPTTHPATTDSPVITLPDSDFESNTNFQSREIPDSANQVAQVPISTDPLEDVRETGDVTVKTPEIECAESKPAPSGLLDECPNDAQCNGAETEEGGTFDSKTGKSNFEEKPPTPIPENIDLSWLMSKMSLSTAETIARKSPSIVSEGTITRQSSENSIMEALDTNSDLQAASKVITSPISDCEDITIFQSRETLDFENHVGQVAISTVRWAPNSPRRDTMAVSLSGWVDATDELNLQVEQTWTDVQFLVPKSSWPGYPNDPGLLESGNFFTFNCFSPPISFPLRFSPEDRIQEHHVSQSSDVHTLQAKPSKPGIQASTSTLTVTFNTTRTFNLQFGFSTMFRTQVQLLMWLLWLLLLLLLSNNIFIRRTRLHGVKILLPLVFTIRTHIGPVFV